MVMTLAALILLCSIFGIVYVTTQIKENKMAKMIAMIVCILLAFASAAFIILTLYFAWAVRMN
ncbi:MAG: hypothetical protein J6W85_06990 [Lachnospiraceae bacterium]|nr:hypothetical protein [Lachnospiraceae bacterium]